MATDEMEERVMNFMSFKQIMEFEEPVLQEG